MKLILGKIGAGALSALAAGCAARPLQAPDAGGSGGTIDFDGGAIGDGGAATEGVPDAPLFTGRRSFAVSSTFSAAGGGTISVPAHAFTMVVDGDRWTAIVGEDAYAVMSSIQPAAGGFRIALPFTFGIPIARCTSADVGYSDLAFTFGPSDELRGSGSGQLTTFVAGARNDVAVTMSLIGLPDTNAPTLSLALAGDLTDPFTSFSLRSSEPLPGLQTFPILRAASGDVVTFRLLATPSSAVDTYVTSFAKPEVLLRYGEAYRVDLSGTVDFAGNAAVAPTTGGLVFTTHAPPPLVAADGFESVTSDTLGGAQVLSGAGDPIISGSRSLYVPPVSAVGPNALTTQLALRLPIAPGATVLRFAFRSVNSRLASKPVFAIASVGGSIAAISENSDSGSATDTTIGGVSLVLGPVTNASIRLPGDASGEIVFARMAPQFSSCGGGPAPPENEGAIIDDMRTE